MAAVREDNLEEIIKNIEGNLEEDAKSGASEEGEIPLKEEENLNESSGEDEEMYSWDVTTHVVTPRSIPDQLRSLRSTLTHSRSTPNKSDVFPTKRSRLISMTCRSLRHRFIYPPLHPSDP